MRRAAALILTAAITVFSGAPAYGAVSVAPSTVPAAVSSDIAFTVVNGTASSTTQVTIYFPSLPAIKTVNAVSPAGWTSIVYAETAVVSRVVYSAGSIAAHEAATFVATFSPPDAAATMLFRIEQKHSDGTTTTPDTASVAIVPGATTSSTVAPITDDVVVDSTTTQADAPATTTTVKVKVTKADGSGAQAGKVFIAIGVVVALTIAVRARRMRR